MSFSMKSTPVPSSVFGIVAGSAVLVLMSLGWAGTLSAQETDGGKATPPPIPFVSGEASASIDTPREDLQNLSLQRNPLKALTPVPGGTMKTADFTRELYQMQWRPGDPIDVYVIRPKGVKRPPVSIYLYGYPVDAERFRNNEFCKLAVRNGVAAIGFVPALTAERYHDVPMKKWFVSELHDSLVKTVHDVQMVINYAATREDLDAGRVGIFGQGAGATIAGLAATVDRRIQVLDLLDPWGDWPAWMAHSRLVPEQERADFLKPSFLEPLASLDPVRWLPELHVRSVKMDDALFETDTPPEAKKKMESALHGAVLKRYSTRDDFQRGALADGQLIQWFQSELLAQLASSATDARSKGDSRGTETPEESR